MSDSNPITPFWIKLATSAINVLIIAAMGVPVCWTLELSLLQCKLVFLGMSAVYAGVALMIPGQRSPAMVLMRVKWAEPYGLAKLMLYALLYLASLSTVLFYIRFPFDLLAANLLLVQLPCVLITGTTLHGKLAGGVTTVRVT